MPRADKNIFKRRKRVFEAVKKSKNITKTVEKLADQLCLDERTIWRDLQAVNTTDIDANRQK